MHILLINQYYHPDIAATAQMCADLAEDLVQAGHRVTVVTGTARYRAPHEGDRALPRQRLPLDDEHRGVRILRVPVLGEGKSGLFPQAAGYLSFLGAALVRLLRRERPDVILALSTPPLVAALGLLVQALRGVGFVYWVQDVYPELAIALDVMTPGGAPARGFSALSALLYRRADAVVALDEAMGQALCRAGASAERVTIIDNWCDGAEVTPCPPRENRLLADLGWAESTDSTDWMTVGYAGNLGRGHDFDTLHAALPRLRGERVRFLFIGDGPQLPALKALVQREGLGEQVRFLPPQARSLLREVLSAGDVGLVTLSAGLAGLLVPSKVYGMMAAGRPILYVGPATGRVAELVQGDNLGESVRNGDVEGLVSALRRLAADPARRVAEGCRAREVFLARYERHLATARHDALLQKVASCRGGRS